MRIEAMRNLIYDIKRTRIVPKMDQENYTSSTEDFGK